jgi:predicted small integral membrane protein
MFWTVPTAIFFGLIAMMILTMIIWELRRPAQPRHGFLPMQTTRGERLFIVLIGCALIQLAWVGLTDFDPTLALGISALYGGTIARWG